MLIYLLGSIKHIELSKSGVKRDKNTVISLNSVTRESYILALEYSPRDSKVVGSNPIRI